jgi:aminopeptidase N
VSRRHFISLHRLVVSFLSLLAALPALAAPPHLELDLRLDPATRVLRATAQWVATDDVRFALHRSLAPTAALADGSPVAIGPEAEVESRRIWRIDARPGARVRIEYGGTLPALDRRLDHRDVLGPLAPMASGEGSFLSAASGWYPAPGRLFTYGVTLSLPAGQRGLVPGRLVSETPPQAERYVARFEFDHAADGIDLMAGPYSVSERVVARRHAAPLRLRTYFTRGLEPLAPGYLADSRRYIELYEKRIGAYPFTEFSIVASPLPTGYGMPTLTYLGAEVLKLPFIRATSLGHEVLHNWWGNGVYPDYERGNWSEGLTTFMADYAYKERESPAAARAMRLAWLRDFAALPAGDHQTLASFRSRAHGAAAAVGYGKSAMVFFMLRDLIGDDAFERGIRRFWEKNRFRIASWDDLRAAFEETSGRPLGAFFDQWLTRAGGPLVRIAGARVSAKSRLSLAIEQTSPAYALRLPVALVSAKRTETRWIEVDRERQTITLDVDAMPESVRLDPELRLWRLLDRSELPPILRQWILARGPRLAIVSRQHEVVSAARVLGEAFFEAKPREMSLSDALRQHEPVLVIGLAADVDRSLAKLNLSRPATLGARGTAQVWTAQRGADDTPVAVVAARDAASLQALARPLPHYGAQSFLAFDGAKAIERGVWPAAARSVPVVR